MEHVFWTPPPPKPLAVPGEVHVWLAAVSTQQHRIAELAALLSADEQERAARFVFERDRIRFIVARGFLRNMLACYLGAEPAAVTLAYNHFGKPEVPGVSFNLSHSGDLILCAVSSGCRVGVDVEHMRDVQALDIAERYFTPGERHVLAELPADQHLRAFYNGWTRKEAYLKAVGRGIGMGLDYAEVSLANVERPEIRTRAPEERWLLRSFEPVPGYVAAIALEADEAAFAFWMKGTRNESRRDGNQ